MKIILTIIFISAAYLEGFAQCLMYPVSLSERINASSMIVEGKVKASNSIWNAAHTHIVTIHTIEVYKILKAESSLLNLTSIELITPGGVVDDLAEKVNPALEPVENEYGIFFLADKTLEGQFKPYAGPQAYIEISANWGADVFSEYADLEKQIYSLIRDLSGMEAIVLKQNNNSAISSSVEVPIITGFSPSSISAGTQSILTISGSGFGVLQGSGSVSFKNADNGGNSVVKPQASEYVVWSDNQIQVRVPTSAGTGTIIVSNNASQNATSTSSLSIPFAHLNVLQAGTTYVTDLVNSNGSGGYTISFFTGFNNNILAKKAYERALKSWGCKTKLNFSIGSTNNKDLVDRDDVSVVRFDDGSDELPAGVLGITINYFTGCLTNVWYAEEMDMIYDVNTNWNFGPEAAISGKYDFESVVLHELGHAHQLGHVIDATEVMHFSIGTGINKRSLSSGDISGGVLVINRSKTANACGPGPTTEKTQTGCNVGLEDLSNSTGITFGPNPYTGDIFSVKNPNQIKNLRIKLYDMMGKEVFNAINSDAVADLSSTFSSLSAGIYLLNFESQAGNESYKMQVIK